MVKRTIRLATGLLLIVAVVACALVIYVAASPVPFREFDSTWYHTPVDVTVPRGRTFSSQHRWVVFRAQADHLLHPVGPGSIILLVGASPPNDAGDVFLFFGSRFASGDAGLHLFPVYCWSEPQQRLLWKGLQNNSP